MSQTFVKFTFLKVDPAWRRLSVNERAQHKREFAAACNDFAVDNFLKTYTLVGTRGDADLLVLSSSANLAHIHELHVVMNQSGLMRFAEIPYSYLAMTKESPYSDEPTGLEYRHAGHKYMFVYPFVKTREWYRLSLEQRRRVMAEHIKIGREYPDIVIHTTYSFGLDDQEFTLAFEGEKPADFLDLVQRLRETESSLFTERDVPIFTCITASVERALSALDGEAFVRNPSPAGA